MPLQRLPHSAPPCFPRPLHPTPPGPEEGPHNRSYTSWAPEPPSEVDLPTWLPIFLDGVREYEEPYRFLAIRGAEELLLKAGDT